jgi:nitroreductase
LERILEAGRWTPTAHNIQNYEIVAVRDPDLLSRIGRIKYIVPQEFLRENLKSVSSSQAEWEQRKTGVLATQVPPEFLVAGRELNEDEQAALNARFEKLITATSCLLIVLYDRSGPAPGWTGDDIGLISLGFLLENMWLMATAQGVEFSIVSILGEPHAAKEISGILGIPEHLSIMFGVRLGRTATTLDPGPRIRRNIDDFSHLDRYGEKGPRGQSFSKTGQ